MSYVTISTLKVLLVSDLYSSRPNHLVRPNNSAVMIPTDARRHPDKKKCPENRTPQIMVPRSKLSLISAVYLL